MLSLYPFSLSLSLSLVGIGGDSITDKREVKRKECKAKGGLDSAIGISVTFPLCLNVPASSVFIRSHRDHGHPNWCPAGRGKPCGPIV